MHRARVGLVSCCALWGATLGACGGGGFSLVPASSSQQQNVMVIDEGFDLAVSELGGRVAATYTETCVDDQTSDAAPSDAAPPDVVASDAGIADAGVSFDQMKQDLLAALTVPDDSCHLTVGIAAKTDPFASIARYRARWNAMIRGNQFADQAFTPDELTQIMDAQNTEFQSFGYHGTSTAGTVVHDNPTVRLVLVERQLASESSLQTSFTCFVQSEIDQAVQLFSDPQVNAALVNQPVQLEADLVAAMRTYDVGLVNESFGGEARAALEMVQAMSCPDAIDLSAYFAVLNQIELAHAATIGGPAVLTVQAAGNDGAEIDSGADSLSCDIGDPLSLLVGSTDTVQVRSTFSDFGACVDVYAPGESVVAPYAGDWLLPLDGTSFAAPIVVRQVSLTTPSSFDPKQARNALLAQRTSDGSLPIALFPNDFFYLPGQTPVAALVAGTRGPRMSHRPVSRVDLHPVLHPLALLRAIRHRRSLF